MPRFYAQRRKLQAARSARFACKTGGIIGGKKKQQRGDVVGASDATKRVPAINALFENRSQ